MTELVRGQKMKLSDLTGARRLEIGLQLQPGAGQTLDVSCFGLDAAGKLSDERYLIFYNQRSSPCGGLRETGAAGDEQAAFAIDLDRLPPNIVKLSVVATLDGTGSLGALGQSSLRLRAEGAEKARFRFDGALFTTEKAVMVADLYLKDIWRLAAVGQGFAGGLSALLAHFGGEEAGAAAAPKPAPTPPPAAPAPAPSPAPSPAAAPTPAPAPKVNLGKVTLEKRGQSQPISLKKGGGLQKFHVNLNWDAPKKKGGFFGIFSDNTPPDLDLGCMFALSDGSAGVIQPLGNRFGSRTEPPFIYLDKDDRSGAATDGENLYILRPDLIDKVMLFALLYEGATKFSDVNARLTIKEESGQEVLIKLDNPDPGLRFCAIGTLIRKGDRIEIAKEERYYPSHKQADEHFGFGFNWVAGRK
ncbi:MAG: TerD family protein [Deltaproteobacteria bacterium]|nr:TerD family protein [Deltaproteobacteria bacterium]